MARLSVEACPPVLPPHCVLPSVAVRRRNSGVFGECGERKSLVQLSIVFAKPGCAHLKSPCQIEQLPRQGHGRRPPRSGSVCRSMTIRLGSIRRWRRSLRPAWRGAGPIIHLRRTLLIVLPTQCLHWRMLVHAVSHGPQNVFDRLAEFDRPEQQCYASGHTAASAAGCAIRSRLARLPAQCSLLFFVLRRKRLVNRKPCIKFGGFNGSVGRVPGHSKGAVLEPLVCAMQSPCSPSLDGCADPWRTNGLPFDPVDLRAGLFVGYFVVWSSLRLAHAAEAVTTQFPADIVGALIAAAAPDRRSRNGLA